MTTETYIDFNGSKIVIKILEKDKNRVPVIFLHDSWGCIEMWGDFPEQIATLTGRSCIVYDRIGYGKSSAFGIEKRTKYYLHHQADVLNELMNALNIPQAILYGHSDGATIALIAAATYTNRFAGLLLEGPHSFIEDSGKDAVKRSRDLAKTNSLLAVLEKFHGNKTDELFRRWHETWLSTFFADWSIISLLRNIDCPVVAFQGVSDPFGTIEQLNILKKEIATNVTIAEISNAAHTPRKENETETMVLIKKFLKQLNDR